MSLVYSGYSDFSHQQWKTCTLKANPPVNKHKEDSGSRWSPGPIQRLPTASNRFPQQHMMMDGFNANN